MSREDVAALAGVPVKQVQRATEGEIRRAYADSASHVVVQIITQEYARYWRVDRRYYLEDRYFGPVVAIDDLRYNSKLGLFRV